ncbi:formylglycine-generating enzyme family protein, partial [Thermodesulfobacteriota bacterium]
LVCVQDVHPDQIGDKYTEWGNSALAGGNYDDAHRYYGKAYNLGLEESRHRALVEKVTEAEEAAALPPALIEMVRIPAGTFSMGSPIGESDRDIDEGPVHQVTITKDFLLGTSEVTQVQWKAVIGSNPSHFNTYGNLHPVEEVSWLDAVKFCNKLSEHEGLAPAFRIYSENVTWIRGVNGYRLPTESEWEYACRAGTTTPFSFGGAISTDQANYDGNYPYGGEKRGEYRHTTTPARTFPANAWGLYDMHGNVWEWCWDWLDEGYYSKSSSTDPTGSEWRGSSRVRRGGGFSEKAHLLRSANRAGGNPSDHYMILGFRVARSLEE